MNEVAHAIAIIQSSGDAIVGSTPDGVVASWNPAAEALYGYSSAEMMGHSLATLVPADRADETGDLLARVLRGESVTQYQTVWQHKDGHAIPISLTASPIADSLGAIIGVSHISRDISEQLAVQEERDHSFATSLAAKNAELEAFTSRVSHDLQEPLRTIHAFSGILVDDYQSLLPEEARTHLGRIQSASVRMKQLIADLLSVSAASLPTTEPQPLDVATVLGDVVVSLTERIAQTGGHVVIADDLPTVLADRTRLQQVFRNLIDNGIKYNHDPAPSVEIGLRSTTANEVTLFVRDNGIGINERFHDRIFDIFQRLHLREEYDGTGAGLAIVKRAVEALNGRVWVESVEGLGSTFLLTLPIPNEEDGTKAA